jgi:hypothetical protein
MDKLRGLLTAELKGMVEDWTDSHLSRRRPLELDEVWETEETVELVLSECKEGLAIGDWRRWSGAADEFIARHALEIPSDSDRYRRLCIELGEVQSQAYSSILRRLSGDYSEPIAVALAPTIAAPTSNDPAPSKTVLEVWELYKAEKIQLGRNGGWKDGEDTAKNDHLPHIRALVEVLGGDKPIREVTDAEVLEYQRRVLEKPNESASNKDKRLGRTGALFRWAKKKRHTQDDFDGLFKYPGKYETSSYLKFSPEDLSLLFESEQYRTGTFTEPARYWLPVLALHTGGRLNELAQLFASDVGEHEGVPTISILDEEGKRLKNTASRRIIPIHSALIAAGFLEFAREQYGRRLFPELPENRAKPGDFTKKPGREFTDYRRSVGVGEVTGRSRKVFHSFRSTLIDALRRGGVPKDRRTRLAGHEYEDTQDTNYDGGDVLTMFPFAMLKEDIERAVFAIELAPYRLTR